MSQLQQAIARDLTTFIRGTFPLAAIQNLNETDDLLGHGIIDSFGLLEVLGFIETTWNLQIEDADITEENFGSIRTISGYITRVLKAESPSSFPIVEERLS